ncbi:MULTISPECIES: putative phage replication protein [Acinetobacter calcoaceticus/baumannii complex]|nr:putative phage replication protein [Acinetobacter baumannii]EHU1703099.1 putative phage replication protein [Acinetobacter baumannii]EHU1999435.1 putative phage replication protein [Acinetobacter baumannii]EHU3345971.1 putative phage replication protein [Acinetobacter baumannii]HCK7400322.1 putative phage replication protein [Acinetobacter baumannii]
MNKFQILASAMLISIVTGVICDVVVLEAVKE